MNQHQNKYRVNDFSNTEAEKYEEHRSLKTEFFFVSSTKPSIHCSLRMPSQFTKKIFFIEAIKNINLITSHLKRTSTLSIFVFKLEVQLLHIFTYSDLSFKNKRNQKCQMSYFFLFMDHYNRCCVLQFSSENALQATRSSLAANEIALVNEFDKTLTFKRSL